MRGFPTIFSASVHHLVWLLLLPGALLLRLSAIPTLAAFWGTSMIVLDLVALAAAARAPALADSECVDGPSSVGLLGS